MNPNKIFDDITEDERRRLARVPSAQGVIESVGANNTADDRDYDKVDNWSESSGMAQNANTKRNSDPLIDLSEEEIHVGTALDRLSDHMFNSPTEVSSLPSPPRETAPKVPSKLVSPELPPIPVEEKEEPVQLPKRLSSLNEVTPINALVREQSIERKSSVDSFSSNAYQHSESSAGLASGEESSSQGIVPAVPLAKKKLLSQKQRYSGDFSTTKRSTRDSLLGRGRDPSRPSSMIVPSNARVSVTNLDDIPDVSLPGFTPHADVAPPSTSMMQSRKASGLLRALSTKQVNNSNNSITDRESSLKRSRTLVRRDRDPKVYKKNDSGLTASQKRQRQSERKLTWWLVFSYAVTFYMPSFFLEKCAGMTDIRVRRAWREKMALVTIVILLCIVMGFITFGMQYLTCGIDDSQIKRFPIKYFNNEVVNIRGNLYDIKNFDHPGSTVELWRVAGKDVSWMFPIPPEMLPNKVSACDAIPGAKGAKISCTVDNVNMVGHCHTLAEYSETNRRLKVVGKQSYDWDDIVKGNRYIVYNGIVLDLDRYFTQGNGFLNDPNLDKVLVRHLGKDATRAFVRDADMQRKMNCLLERFQVGVLEQQSASCFASSFFTWISLTTILAVLIARFCLATIYNWKTTDNFLHSVPKLPENNMRSSSARESSDLMNMERTNANSMLLGEKEINGPLTAFKDQKKRPSSLLPTKSRFSTYNLGSSLSNKNRPSSYSSQKTKNESSSVVGGPPIVQDPNILRTIVLITCYSEDEAGIRATLDSIARTDYPDDHKMLFIIADGLVTGSGNSRSTPDILVNTIQLDPQFEYPPPPHSYVAVAEGQKRHNMARVYAGQYFVDGHSVPTILVVKCGAPEEKNDPKPGNRGKRDSQVILMQFLSRVMFDDRLTALEFDIFTKMTTVCSGPLGMPLELCKTKITPDLYELVLFVDADTKVLPDAMLHMSYAMANDNKIIGLCGETKIANPTKSFTTAIQVFEYYISHYLAKSFESFFGKVTCLPGCFCMYRIKAPKPVEDGSGFDYFVPILANPDIVEAYSEHIVETLHRKNLLLLGEDRYLTTNMLKTFPKRSLVFVPQAACETMVPEKFSVLLSQRRRWINSTVHNLMELVIAKHLCGIFCFSLQFVIFMELLGTAVLPAAVCFTAYLIVACFVINPPPIVPMALLIAILGLPAILIMVSSRRWINILWMLIYLFALPIWNFILPVYAFYNMDNFTWGETRKVDGDKGGEEDGEGEFDHTKITMKPWSQWELERSRNKTLDTLTGRRLTQVPMEARNLASRARAPQSMIDFTTRRPRESKATSSPLSKPSKN